MIPKFALEICQNNWFMTVILCNPPFTRWAGGTIVHVLALSSGQWMLKRYQIHIKFAIQIFLINLNMQIKLTFDNMIT